MANIVFRVDANAQIGSGHLMRCLTLAKALAGLGHTSFFVCYRLPEEQQRLIEELGFAQHSLDESCLSEAVNRPYAHSKWLPHSEQSDAEAFGRTLESCGQSDLSWVVVDHYALAADWETEVRHYLAHSAQLLVIDDLADRPHSSDLLLDQTLGRSAQDYSLLCAPSTLYFLGPNYALLRDEFVQLRSQQKPVALQANSFSLLITLGGADPANCAELVLQALEQVELELTVTFLAGSLNHRADALKQLCDASRHKTDFYLHSSDMAKLYTQADLCVGASGASSWERCVIGLPTLNLVLAANQEKIAMQLMQVGAIDNFGYLHEERVGELAEKITALLSSADELKLMSARAASVCDGLGARRVAVAMDTALRRKPALLHLRKATAKDIDLVYQWQCQPATRKYARNTDVPSFEEHLSWMARRLADGKSYFYIIEMVATAVGVLRLDEHALEPEQQDGLELSIFIDQAFHGKGIAAGVLDAVSFVHFCDNVWAYVSSENLGSQKLFEGSPFTRLDANRFQHNAHHTLAKGNNP